VYHKLIEKVRTFIRFLLLTLGIFILIISGLMLLLSSKQIHKNRLELAAMRDRVAAVEKFELKNNRPPAKDEFQGLLAVLPSRYGRHPYEIASTSDDCPIKVSGDWPKTSGWVLYFWRGEWYEYYCSWNKYHTLTGQASWWGFCGIILFMPLVGCVLIAGSFIPALNRKIDRAKNTSPSVVHHPTFD
jgi:hypothetical protein